MSADVVAEVVDELLAAVDQLTRYLNVRAAQEPAVGDDAQLRALKEAVEDAAYQVRKNRP